MKLAIVYDRVNKWGGAERVLLALHDLWPDAPLFTAVYDPKKARWADVFHVHSSFLQKVPCAKNYHEFFPWLTPMAFESFNFDGFDVVLSVTSAEAKDIITKPNQVHICYCLTPTRYLWSGEKEYDRSSLALRIPFQLWKKTLRKWDKVASSRPDYYLAISRRVADRIQTYYGRTVESVIYPPVDTRHFVPGDTKRQDDYFLTVGRLVPYKRVDLLIGVFNRLGWKLKIIGDGVMRHTLQQQAGKTIEFLGGHLTDAELLTYYQRCRGFVFAGEEDFGIVSLEAQACGKPVICPRKSGMAETVIEGKTGELFEEDLRGTLQMFVLKQYDSNSCRKNAERFNTARFKKEMRTEVDSLTHHI